MKGRHKAVECRRSDGLPLDLDQVLGGEALQQDIPRGGIKSGTLDEQKIAQPYRPLRSNVFENLQRFVTRAPRIESEAMLGERRDTEGDAPERTGVQVPKQGVDLIRLRGAVVARMTGDLVAHPANLMKHLQDGELVGTLPGELTQSAADIHGHDIIDLVATYPDGIRLSQLMEIVDERFGRSVTFSGSEAVYVNAGIEASKPGRDRQSATHRIRALPNRAGKAARRTSPDCQG
jgi:hypothetical protein